MANNERNWFKFFVGWIICFGLRLIPGRPPNIEPILATQMPYSKKWGYGAGFIFAFLNIVLFDSITSGLGVWTVVTALTYGVLGLGAAYFFAKRPGSMLNYGLFAVVGTLFYDAVTGLTIGPFVFGQSFSQALVGQIPFTLMHLLGNVTLAMTVSPLIYRWVVNNHQLADEVVWRKLNWGLGNVN